MSSVLCAVRAGRLSRSTIDKALSLSVENESKVYFLIVIDPNVFTEVVANQLPALSRKMKELAQTVLIGAQNMATSQGVLSEGLLREGRVADEIISVSKSIRADQIVVGQPAKNSNNNIFSLAGLENFYRRVKVETLAELIMV